MPDTQKYTKNFLTKENAPCLKKFLFFQKKAIKNARLATLSALSTGFFSLRLVLQDDLRWLRDAIHVPVLLTSFILFFLMYVQVVHTYGTIYCTVYTWETNIETLIRPLDTESIIYVGIPLKVRAI